MRHTLTNVVIAELSAYLQSTISAENSHPDETEVYNDTGIFVGGEGWRELGTKDNTLNILKHTTLLLHYVRESQTVRLATLVKQ